MFQNLRTMLPGRATTPALVFWLACAPLAAGCGDDAGPAGPGGGGSGGAGGGSGGTGGAGGGSGGGAPGACLDPSAYAALFTITDPSLCAAAVHTTDLELGFAVPTWGGHGGPLVAGLAAAGAVELVRLTPPAGPDGPLAAASATVDAGIPDGAFLGAQALDLPFFGWTAISWSGAFPDTLGELILLEGAAVARRYDVNGLYGAAGLSTRPGAAGRVLYTGLSPLGDPAAGPNALYAADTCGAAGPTARLLPEGDPSCAPPQLVAAWGDFSGPVTVDRAGHAFVVLPTFGGDQEARGFAAGAIARGAGPTEGAVLFTLPGGGASLAALAPQADAPGLLAFQPTDPDTFAYLDPIGVTYTVAGDVVGASAPAPLLTLATPNTPLTLMVDPNDRLWVGAATPGGGTTFVVLVRP